jgi:predicted RNA-binding Zn-ribbon protein involved in translation (DUF1610 family)
MRHLFTICAVVSLLLCAAVVIIRALMLWPMPPEFTWMGERVPRSKLLLDHRSILLELGVAKTRVRGPDGVGPDAKAWEQMYRNQHTIGRVGDCKFWWRWAMIINSPSRREFGGYSYGVEIPYWMAFALTAPLPALRFTPPLLKWRRTRMRRAAGRCTSCGYDLRESPHRCPECGYSKAETATATKQSPTAGV